MGKVGRAAALREGAAPGRGAGLCHPEGARGGGAARVPQPRKGGSAGAPFSGGQRSAQRAGGRCCAKEGWQTAAGWEPLALFKSLTASLKSFSSGKCYPVKTLPGKQK